MDRLVELLCVDRHTESELNAILEGVGVGEGDDSLVGDLSLGERSGTDLVLRGKLKVNSLGRLLGVPGGLGSDLDKVGRLGVIAGREYGKLGGGGREDRVAGARVSDTSGVTLHSTSGDVVLDLTTNGGTRLGESKV